MNKVICIDNNGYEKCLTLNKKYSLNYKHYNYLNSYNPCSEIYLDSYPILDDNVEMRLIKTKCFITLEEFRKNRLNLILNE